MIVDRIDNWRQCLDGPVWQRAFEFLASLKPDAEEGKVELMGSDMFAIVQSYETRWHEEAVLEAHRSYIDIQTPLAGSEAIEWFPTKDLAVKTPYDPSNDVEFFHRPGPAPARVDACPGVFVVLFPGDAHMPQLMTGENLERVNKVVVKVRTSLLGRKPALETQR